MYKVQVVTTVCVQDCAKGTQRSGELAPMERGRQFKNAINKLYRRNASLFLLDFATG